MSKHKNFWQITEDSLDKSMKKFRINNNMRSELLDLYKTLSPYPEVRETLKQLKNKNYKIAILSNGTPSLLNELVEKNDMKNLFDDIFSIEEVGIFKPSSKDFFIIEFKIGFLSSKSIKNSN